MRNRTEGRRDRRQSWRRRAGRPKSRLGAEVSLPAWRKPTKGSLLPPDKASATYASLLPPEANTNGRSCIGLRRHNRRDQTLKALLRGEAPVNRAAYLCFALAAGLLS